MNEKKDWFSLVYENQDASFSDYLNNGIKSTDVELRDKDFYKTNDAVIQAFTDESGEFNETAFDQFYNNAVLSYNTFSMGDFEENSLPELQWDIMSGIAAPGEKIQGIDLKLHKEKNPFIESRGVSSIFGYSDTDLTEYEIAQSNRIWDTENNRWMDKTPEDLGFWGTVFETPIVFARYDEDIMLPDAETGRMVQHYKGEMKLDENGKPYYETLGKRDADNKEFLSPFNVITREGTWLNKIDFMDNDGKDKSIVGTIAQTIFTIAPMLIPTVGQYYTGAVVLKNAAQLGITLKEMFDGITDSSEDYDYGILDTIKGKLMSFDPGVSQYSKEHMVTFENFGNLISDVVSQLYQQQLIAQLPKFMGLSTPEKAMYESVKNLSGDNIAKTLYKNGTLDGKTLAGIAAINPTVRLAGTAAAKRYALTGKWASSFYMSGISTMDVFQDAKDAGYSDDWAAFTTAIAMAATTWLVGSTEIGQWALKGMGFEPERKVLRDAGKKLIKLIQSEIPDLSWKTAKDPKVFNRILRKAKNIYSTAGELINTGGVLGAGLAESMEEMSEEAIMDFSKEFTDAITGVFGVQPEANFKFLESNPLERYLMAGAGGAVGGAIFRLKNRMSEVNQKLPKDTKEQIFYFLRNGKKEDLKKQLEKLWSRGVAPKNLSALRTEVINGETKYLPLEQDGTSLNDAVVGLANNLIDQWDAVINQEQLNFDDHSLLEMISLKDKRVKDLLNFEGVQQVIKDYNAIGTEIVELSKRNAELREQIDPGKGKEGINIEESTAELNRNEARLTELRDRRAKLLNGSLTEEYVSKSLFFLSDIKDPILATDIVTYSKYALNKDYNTLSEDEKKDIQERYQKYKSNFDVKFNEAYTLFTELSKKYGKSLLDTISKLPLLDGMKKYLSGADEGSLLSLDAEAKRLFEADRKLNKTNIGIESATATNKGLGYIFDNASISFKRPDVQQTINDVIGNLTVNLNGIDTNIGAGIDISTLISGFDTFGDFSQSLYADFLSKLTSQNEDGSTSDFTALLDNTFDEIYSGVDLASHEYLNNKLLEYGDLHITNPIYKQLFNNLVAAAYNSDINIFRNNLISGLNQIYNIYTTSLIPRIRLATAKQLLEDAKKEGIEITKDLYSQILNYLKPNNAAKINLDKIRDNLMDGSILDIESGLEDYELDDLAAALNVNRNHAELAKNLAIKASKLNNWFEIFNLVKNSELSSDEQRRFMTQLGSYDDLEGLNLNEYDVISELILDESQIKSNPISDLLNQLEIEVIGGTKTNIFDLLDNENQILKSTNSLSDFIIQGKIKQSEIKSAIQTIDLLQSILASTIKTTNLNGTGYGYNTALNQFRDEQSVTNPVGSAIEITNEEVLPEIDQDSAQKMMFELNRIKSQLNFFQQLSEQNLGNKLREHKAIAINTRKLLINHFKDPVFTSKCPQLYSGITEIMSEYDISKLTEEDLQDEDYFKQEELVNRIEDKLYDNAINLEKSGTLTREQIIGMLFNGYDYSTFMKSEYYLPEGFKSTTEAIDLHNLYIYYHTILSIKSSDFNKGLKDVIEDEIKAKSDKLLIPLFQQEFNTRINVAMIVNPNLMNNIVRVDEDKINSIKSDHLKTRYGNYINYYYNLVFNNGAPGVGKTNGVGKLTHKIITKLLGEKKVVMVGPQSQQAINLVNAILDTNYNADSDISTVENEVKVQNNHVLTKNQLLDAIYKDIPALQEAQHDFETEENPTDPTPLVSDKVENIIVKEENFQVYRLRESLLTPDKFKEGAFADQDILYIDEITHFSKFELEVLTTWALMNNKILITFGDLVQSGYNREKDGYAQGIDTDATVVTTPTLNTSLRITNIHKKDNFDALKTLADELYIKQGEGVDLNIVALKYYEDNHVLHGEKITPKITEADLNKLDGSISYIYDKIDTDTYRFIEAYNASHGNKIKMFRLNQVQGLETDYAVVDLHLNISEPDLKIRSFRNLYTGITRSKAGTYIIDNGLTPSILKPSESVDYTQESIINAESAKSFADLRLKSLDYLLRDYKPTEIKVETKTKAVASTTKTIDSIISDVLDEDDKKSTETLIRVDKETKTKYPTDEFICYTFPIRIVPTKKSSIVSGDEKFEYYDLSSLYIAHGLEGSDLDSFFYNLDGISVEDYNKVDTAITSLRSAIYSNTSRDNLNKILTGREGSEIRSKLQEAYNDITGDGELQFDKLQFKLKAIKYKPNRDFSDDTVKEDLRLVAQIPVEGNPHQSYIEIYIYSFPDANNTTFKDMAWFKEYKGWYSEKMKGVVSEFNNIKLQDSKYYAVTSDFELHRITNLVIYNKNKFEVPLEEAAIKLKGMYFSAPYIVANFNNEKSKRYSDITALNEKIDEYQTKIAELNIEIESDGLSEDEKKDRRNKISELTKQMRLSYPEHTLRGKACVFVTFDENLRDASGNIVTPDMYESYYLDQLNGVYDSDPDKRDKVRMIMLSPRGLSFREFFDKYQKYIKKTKTSKLDAKYYKTYVGDYTGFDIIVSLIQYRNYLVGTLGRSKDDLEVKIVEGLYNGLSWLSGDPAVESKDVERFKPIHIKRLMERMRIEFSDEAYEWFNDKSESINGNDILYYLSLVVDAQKPSKYQNFDRVIENIKDGKFVHKFSSDITADRILDVLERATTGKYTDKGEVKTLKDYNPLFKYGFFPFPVIATNTDKDSQTSDKEFVRAVNYPGTYLINTDLQPPKFAFRSSTMDPTMRSETSTPEPPRPTPSSTPSSISSGVTSSGTTSSKSSKPTSIRGTGTSTTLEFEKLRSEHYRNILNVLHNIPAEGASVRSTLESKINDELAGKNIEYYKSNTFEQTIQKVINAYNNYLKLNTVEFDSDTNLKEVMFNDREITYVTEPKPTPKSDEIIRISGKYKVSLPKLYNDEIINLNDISDAGYMSYMGDLQNVETILDSMTPEQINSLSQLYSGKFTSELYNLISSDPEFKEKVISINNFRNNYNLC